MMAPKGHSSHRRDHGWLIGISIVILLIMIAVVVLVSLTYAKKCKPAVEDKYCKPHLLTTSMAQINSPAPMPHPIGPNMKNAAGVNEFTSTPKCAEVPRTWKHDRYLTWYGVQKEGTVTIDYYEQNAKAIITYLQKSKVGYQGILLSLDNPVSSHGIPNFSANVDKIVNIIASVPLQYRVGVRATVESDAAWQITATGTPTTYAPTDCAATQSCTLAPDANYCSGVNPVVGTTACDCLVNPTDGSCADQTTTCKRCYWVDYFKGPGKTNPHFKNSSCADTGKCMSSPTPAVSMLAHVGDGSSASACPPNTMGVPAYSCMKPTDGSCPRCWYNQYYQSNGQPHFAASLCQETNTCTSASASAGGNTNGNGNASASTTVSCPDSTLGLPAYSCPDVTPGASCPYCWYNQYWKAPGQAQFKPSDCQATNTCIARPVVKPPAVAPAPGHAHVPSPAYVSCPTGSQTLPGYTCPDQSTGSSCPYCWYNQYENNGFPHYAASDCQSTNTCIAGTPLPPGPSPPAPTKRIQCTSSPMGPFGSKASDPNACWYVVSESTDPTIIGTMPPGEAFTPAGMHSNVYYGGPPPCLKGQACPSITSGPISDPTGYPFQATSPATVGDNACPYKMFAPPPVPGQPPAPVPPFPAGCPGNMSRLGWYVAMVNAKLRALEKSTGKPQQRISMMNWDAENNGPTGATCATFQFLYALRQFGTSEDVHPPVGIARTPTQWTLFQNGKGGLLTSAGYDVKEPCGYWSETPIDIGATAVSMNTTSGVSTYGDMAAFQAAPEYYWFDNGEDSGNSFAHNTPSPADPGADVGLMPYLKKAGYIGCWQSSPDKPQADYACGCRRTVYDTYAHVDNGGKRLIEEALGPIYNKYAQYNSEGVMTETPTFSIEHLGDRSDASDFGQCINAVNFCKGQNGNACTTDSKCMVRCGVANFFGNFTEQCFVQFLNSFSNTYKPPSLLVYDAGFIPASWIQEYDPTFTGEPAYDCNPGSNDKCEAVSGCTCPTL